MEKIEKIIFAGKRAICREPMAAAILQREHLNFPVEILARGIVVLFPEPLNPKAEAVLTSNGYPQPSHIAMQLEQEDINNDVLILTMEDKQKSQIWETYENAPHVYTVKEYVGESGDIPSLHGQPLTVYSQCYTELELLMRKLVTRLNEEEEL